MAARPGTKSTVVERRNLDLDRLDHRTPVVEPVETPGLRTWLRR
jgi:hypothetical protein